MCKLHHRGRCNSHTAVGPAASSRSFLSALLPVIFFNHGDDGENMPWLLIISGFFNSNPV